MIVDNTLDFKNLIVQLNTINSQLQEQAIKAVNTSLTIRNWFFGFYIVEFEQNGKDRAKYGKKLLSSLSDEMKNLNIQNTDERALRQYRQFYMIYSGASAYLFEQNLIRQTVSPISKDAKNSIRQTVFPKLNLNNDYFVNIFDSLSYSHFVELIRVDDEYKRLFYEMECIKGVWSVRELKRQIGSLLYERTGLSKDKEKLMALTQQKTIVQTTKDIIRDPYVFEFIGLKQQEVILEKDLEKALLEHLLEFLLEMGKGFCFEAKQKRIVIDNEHHFIDLVFYHRILHCNILIELKTERFNHSHSGQLNLYLEYYKKYEMNEGDNPPIGILLCTEKDAEYVSFATAGLDDKIFVSKYLVDLPKKELLEEFIKNKMNYDV